MPGFIYRHLKFCATKIQLDMSDWKLRLTFLERSKICDEIRIFFAKDVGYKKQPEQLFQLVRAIYSP